jgi:DNA-3-methyladenine glycosylase I
MKQEKKRCAWCEGSLLYQAYHDEEWGVPVYDECRLFESLCLEGMQAGLSWLIVLKKREAYRSAFANFDVEKISRFTQTKIAKLLTHEGIIRHSGKINAIIENAKCWQKLKKQQINPVDLLWSFTNHQTIHNCWHELSEIPSVTDISQKMSAVLKKHGFKFVGPTICYAFMKACGMVNDHLIHCYRYQEILDLYTFQK